MTNIISIYNLSKAFDGKKLFQNFNFTVKKNSVHALIGANGAGKTTLLRLLTGLYEPDEGKISVSGKHAMLLENDYLYEDKTGLENLKIFGLYFGYYVKDYKKYSDCPLYQIPGHSFPAAYSCLEVLRGKTPFAVSNSGWDGQVLYARSIFPIPVP